MPSVCRKIFLSARVNEEDGSENDAGYVTEEESDDSDAVSLYEDIGIKNNRENVVPPSAYNFDRRITITIEDHATAGPASYTATKNVKPRKSTSDGGANRGALRTKVTSIAVREHGTAKHFIIRRFLYTVLTTITADIETWIAVPKAEPYGDYLLIELILEKNEYTRQIISSSLISITDKYVIERFLLQHCKVVTIGQRCAEWFVLRHFRITGTVAGKALSRDEGHRGVVGNA